VHCTRSRNSVAGAVACGWLAGVQWKLIAERVSRVMMLAPLAATLVEFRTAGGQ